MKLSSGIVILGVAFEYFDLMLVNLLASSIIADFVDAHNTQIYAYLAYAIAFVFRPVGAILFGSIGDLFGRKRALISSMLLMSLATLGIALIPSHKEIGILASVLFFLCRICQGLSVGGEYGTAMTYAFEIDAKFRTFYGACVVSATHIGGVFASFLASRYSTEFRIPFFIGGFLGLLFMCFRSALEEGPCLKVQTLPDLARDTVRESSSIFKAAAIAATFVFVFYGTLIYVNEWVFSNFKIDRAIIFRYNTYLLSLWVVIPPVIGYLVDKFRFEYKLLMCFGILGMILSAPLLSFAMLSGNHFFVFGSQVCLHLCIMFFSLGSPRYFGELFRKDIRNTAVSTSYSLGASYTSALAPLVCHGFVLFFNSPKGLMIPLLSLSAIAGFILLKEYGHQKKYEEVYE